MPLTVSHVLSATTPDDPAYEIRPSHWNSAHAFTLNASGSEISGAFSNAGNVTFGLETNGFITATANAAGAGDGFNRIAAGTQTAGTNNTIVFANSNGVTFGMSGSTQITASHNGITQQSTQPVAFSAGAASSNFSTLVFQDSNGVSWSNNAGSIRASVRTDYLTTARASTDAIGLNTAKTNVTWTVNSSGISLDGGGYAGTGTSATNASVTLNSNGLAISVAAPGGGGNFSAGVSTAGNTAGSTGITGTRLVFVGTNNITLSQSTDASGGTLSIRGPDLISAGVTNAGNTSGDTGFVTGQFNLQGGNNITLSGSTNGGSMSVTVSAPNYAVSNSAGSFTFKTLNFSNANNVTWGTSAGGIVTASVNAGGAFSAGVSGGNTSNTSGVTGSRVVFAGGNNITLSQSNDANGASITISGANAGGAQTGISGIQNSQTTYTSGTVALSEGGGAITIASTTGQKLLFSVPATSSLSVTGNASISLNGSTISLGANAAAVSLAGNSTSAGAGYSNVSSGTLVLAGGNNITLSQNGASVTISGANGGGAGFTGGVSNLGNTSGNTGTQTGSFVLAGGNNITLSVATAAGGHQTITISGANVAAGNITVSAGTTSGGLGAITFNDSNGVSFGLNAGVITATVKTDYQSSNANYLTSQSNQAFSASGGSSAFQTLNFANSNGATFTNTNGSVALSYTVPTVTNSSLTMQAGASTLSSVSRIAFADSNGVSFGASTSNNGSITITATVRTDWLSTQSNQAFSASGGSSAFQTLNFANSNGLTFSNSNGSVIASYTVPTQSAQTLGLYASSQTTAQSSSSTVDARSLTIVGAGNISVGLSGGSFIVSQTGGAGANPAASASNGSFTFQTLGFSNANNVTFGTSAGGIITASVAAPGAAAENNWFALSGNTSGNTTASGSTINLSGINLTLSGTNGSQIAISAPATSSLVGTNGISLSTNGSTISVSYVPDIMSRYVNEPSITQVGNAAANSLVSIVPVFIPDNLAVSNVRFGLSANVATAGNNSSGFNNNSVSLVFYTRNGSTLSSFNSASNTYTASWSSNATGSVVGPRGLTVDLATATTLTAGEYWVAVHVSSNNTGPGANTTALAGTYSMLVGATAGSAALGLDPWAAATAATRGASIGLGAISTGATRGTIAISDITQTGTRAMAAKLWMDFRNYSVW